MAASLPDHENTDLKDYYLATILFQMKDWTNTQPNMLWGNIENYMTPSSNPKNWLFSTTTTIPHLHLYSPTI